MLFFHSNWTNPSLFSFVALEHILWLVTPYHHLSGKQQRQKYLKCICRAGEQSWAGKAGKCHQSWDGSKCHTPVPSLPNTARLWSSSSCQAWSQGRNLPIPQIGCHGANACLGRAIAPSLFMSTMFKSHPGCLEHYRQFMPEKEWALLLQADILALVWQDIKHL